MLRFLVFLLASFWPKKFSNFVVHGQTASGIENGAIGNLYVGGFEQLCSTKIEEYLACLATKDETNDTCYNENLDLLSCMGNCPDDFRNSWFCVAGGGLCTNEIFQWIECSQRYCAERYLVEYGQCVATQRTMGTCSSCPFLVSNSDSTDLLTLPPTCAVFEQDYCEWQMCCEPCQYYLNFYGRCMQVNFNTCQDFFKANPSLPSCPLQITSATPPQPPPNDNVPSDGDDSTNDMVGEPDPARNSSGSFQVKPSTFWAHMALSLMLSLFMRFG